MSGDAPDKSRNHLRSSAIRDLVDDNVDTAMSCDTNLAFIRKSTNINDCKHTFEWRVPKSIPTTAMVVECEEKLVSQESAFKNLI